MTGIYFKIERKHCFSPLRSIVFHYPRRKKRKERQTKILANNKIVFIVVDAVFIVAKSGMVMHFCRLIRIANGSSKPVNLIHHSKTGNSGYFALLMFSIAGDHNHNNQFQSVWHHRLQFFSLFLFWSRPFDAHLPLCSSSPVSITSAYAFLVHLEDVKVHWIKTGLWLPTIY